MPTHDSARKSRKYTSFLFRRVPLFLVPYIQDYDGGDCCECTCTKNNGGDGCYEFQCVDPAAECVDDDDITVDQVENCGYVPGIGKRCDEQLAAVDESSQRNNRQTLQEQTKQRAIPFSGGLPESSHLLRLGKRPAARKVETASTYSVQSETDLALPMQLKVVRIRQTE